jgi:hypothetical protein
VTRLCSSAGTTRCRTCRWWYGRRLGAAAIPSGPWSLDEVRAAAARVHAAEPDAAYAKDTLALVLLADADLTRAAALAEEALTDTEGHDRVMVLCTLIGIANAQGNAAWPRNEPLKPASSTPIALGSVGPYRPSGPRQRGRAEGLIAGRTGLRL